MRWRGCSESRLARTFRSRDAVASRPSVDACYGLDDVSSSHRRLAAILAADVVAYSRLMGDDEEGTLRTLDAKRVRFAEAIEHHHGRVVDTAGDSILAVFPSVVEAVRCAVEVQTGFRDEDRDVPAERRMQFRIGVNLGDVIEKEDGTVYGDGVNVAARLEGLAPPGGVIVSESAHMQVRSKLNLAYEDLGPQRVKNIAEPVAAFSVHLASEDDAAVGPPAEKVVVDDKPTIAVLPFANMTADPEQEFFVDGLTEDILTELSRFRELFVISRNSVFVHKGKAVNVRDVARDLGARYVVEGSVRKARNRIRVTVQLIDAEVDGHIWAERYDRELADIFEIQDELTSAIVATLPGRIEAASHKRAARKLPESLQAWEYVLAGKQLHHRSERESNVRAQENLERALALEPSYAHAHAWKACVLGQAWVHGWTDDVDGTWRQVVEELQAALALDDNDSDVHRILAAVSVAGGDHDKALYHQKRALGLNPNDDLIVVQQGEILTWIGQPVEGIEWIEKAMRLNPHHPERFWNHLGRANFVARRYAAAVDAFRRITGPDYGHHAFLAASHAQQGDEDDASRHAREVLSLVPDFSVETYLATQHHKHAEDREHHREALVKAGLP